MPTVLLVNGFRFVIYLNDHRPPHVHIHRSGCELVVELETYRVIRNRGHLFKPTEITKIMLLVRRYESVLSAKWRDLHEKEDD